MQAELNTGRNVVLNLEAVRAKQLKANMPEAVCVYMAPSTDGLLRERYEKTARSPFEVSARMDVAAQEKQAAAFCDRTIFTDDADEAAKELGALLDQA